MKLAATVLCLTILRLNAIGQVKTDGTIIIVDASERELVIAADSRSTGSHTYDDDNCKISAFGNKVVFAASGRTGSRNQPSDYWDVHAIAGKEFNRLASGKRAIDDLLVPIAKAWGKSVEHKIEQRLIGSGAPSTIGELDSAVIVGGMFAGFKTDGTIMAVWEQIRVDTSDPKHIRIEPTEPHVLTSRDYPWWMGKSEIVREFMNRRTPRSEQWNKSVDVIVHASSDPIATLAIEHVRLTILNLPPSKKDAHGVPFSEVGGPISAIRLTRKGTEWIEKGKCPQK